MMGSGASIQCRGARMQKREWKVLTVWCRALGIVAAAVVGSGNAVALSYSAKPITAQVVDADTKEPLADVIVLVLWELEDIRGGGGECSAIEETVGDPTGQFTSPRGGHRRYRRAPTGACGDLIPSSRFSTSTSPGIDSRSSLTTWTCGGLVTRLGLGDPVRASEWNGKQIELQRFVGTEAPVCRSAIFCRRTYALAGMPLGADSSDDCRAW